MPSTIILVGYHGQAVRYVQEQEYIKSVIRLNHLSITILNTALTLVIVVGMLIVVSVSGTRSG